MAQIRADKDALQKKLDDMQSSITESIGPNVSKALNEQKKNTIRRAHLHVFYVDNSGNKLGEPLGFRVNFVNDGNLPTTNVQNFGSGGFVEFSIQDIKSQIRRENAIYDEFSNRHKQIGNIIPNSLPVKSRSYLESISSVVPSSSEMENARAGKLSVYFFGRIYYMDAANIIRHTDYCYLINANIVGMKQCFGHNEEP